jgi:hypothetical protein
VTISAANRRECASTKECTTARSRKERKALFVNPASSSTRPGQFPCFLRGWHTSALAESGRAHTWNRVRRRRLRAPMRLSRRYTGRNCLRRDRLAPAWERRPLQSSEPVPLHLALDPSKTCLSPMRILDGGCDAPGACDAPMNLRLADAMGAPPRRERADGVTGSQTPSPALPYICDRKHMEPSRRCNVSALSSERRQVKSLLYSPT